MSRVALITGGSSDIGRAIALELASAGNSIILQYCSRAEAAQEVVKELETNHAHSALRFAAYPADLSKEEDVRSLFRKTRSEFGGLDILVNNASFRADGPLISMSAAKWKQVFEVVAQGSFLCTKEALLDMTRKRFGRIVNITSVSALTGWAGQANYSSAKSALIGLTKVTAREYGRYGVTCNAIAPGLIETVGIQDVSETARQDILQRAVIQRLGTPQEVSAAVRFLSSDSASFITGQVLAVDGGFSIS